MVVWQSLSLVLAAFTIFALVGREPISIDLAVALIILLSSWLMAHIEDASYWFNRNIAIISNIERQFLLPTDLHDIHPYFKGHRNNSKIDHLQLQWWFGLMLSILAVTYHVTERIIPETKADLPANEFSLLLPYIAAAFALVVVVLSHRQGKQKYSKLLRESPGKQLEDN